MSTDEKLLQAREEFISSATRRYDHVIQTWATSPIERLFVATMLTCDGEFEAGEQAYWVGRSALAEHAITLVDGSESRCLAGSGCVLAFVQPKLSVSGRTLTPDLIFVDTRNGRRLAVELDGHDFHERTRYQASRDKARDRRLLATGWPVIRFTGSEVYADADSCIRECIDIMRTIGL